METNEEIAFYARNTAAFMPNSNHPYFATPTAEHAP
jgi:hypothetical protein